MVVGYLELHDEFRLFQTCSAIRARKERDWPLTVSSLPRYRQFEFWVGLADLLSDCVVCAACCKMHKAGREDTPAPGPRKLLTVNSTTTTGSTTFTGCGTRTSREP